MIYKLHSCLFVCGVGITLLVFKSNDSLLWLFRESKISLRKGTFNLLKMLYLNKAIRTLTLYNYVPFITLKY